MNPESEEAFRHRRLQMEMQKEILKLLMNFNSVEEPGIKVTLKDKRIALVNVLSAYLDN